MRHYYYLDLDRFLIRITAYMKPRENRQPRNGTWIITELQPTAPGSAWVMPAIPEITWGTLKKLKYIGSTLVHSD